MSRPPTYTELVRRVNELEGTERDWATLNERLLAVEATLDALIGTELAEEPLVVYEVRRAMRDLRGVLK